VLTGAIAARRHGLARSVESGDPVGLTDEAYENAKFVAGLAARAGGDYQLKLYGDCDGGQPVHHLRYRKRGDETELVDDYWVLEGFGASRVDPQRLTIGADDGDASEQAGTCILCGNTHDHADLGYIDYSHEIGTISEHAYIQREGRLVIVPWDKRPHGAGRVRLGKRDQRTVDLLAHLYHTRKLIGAADFGVLISMGFRLTVGHGYWGYEEAATELVDVVDRRVELLLTPVTVEARFMIPVGLLEDTFKKAKVLYPDLDLRRQWLGDRPLDPEGLRVDVRMLYYVPDAAGNARGALNGPPLGVYPTATYPHGYLNLPRAVWRNRSVRCSDYDALTMALILPLDDLLHLDFAPHSTTGGLPPLRGGNLLDPLRGLINGEINFGLSYGVYVGNAEHETAYAYTLRAAVKRVEVEFAMDAPLTHIGPGPELAPPISELLRLQRPTVLDVARVVGLSSRDARVRCSKRNRKSGSRRRKARRGD